jgi:hypothetical protein
MIDPSKDVLDMDEWLPPLELASEPDEPDESHRMYR